MPDITWNKSVWNKDYKWPLDGDEWSQQAEFCGVPYERWKDSLARTFLITYLKESSVVVEIGPGHGRWTAMIPSRIPKGVLHLVELSPSCIEFCRKKFTQHPNVQYHVNDGRTLPFLKAGSADFVFSFDTFVHLEEPEIRSYAKEFFRVLKPQGMGAIHHSGTPTPEQRVGGARSMVGTRQFGDILRAAGFFVIRQTSEWGQGCNLKMTADAITVFVKP
jgi:ubiquinone/menaquinone biosynthesis C-methylase UbiE